MGKDAFEGSRSHIIVDIRHKIKVLVYTYIRIKKMYSKPLKGIWVTFVLHLSLLPVVVLYSVLLILLIKVLKVEVYDQYRSIFHSLCQMMCCWCSSFFHLSSPRQSINITLQFKQVLTTVYLI